MGEKRKIGRERENCFTMELSSANSAFVSLFREVENKQ